MTTRLTLNAGLRYEFNKPPVDADDRMAIFDQDTATLRPVGRTACRARALGRMEQPGASSGRQLAAPRERLVVAARRLRVYYDASTLIENSALYFNPPFFTFRVFVPGGPVLPTAADPFPEAAGFEPPISVNTLAPVFPTAHRHQASVGLDTRVHGVDVSHAGSARAGGRWYASGT